MSWTKNDNSFHGYQHETRERMPIIVSIYNTYGPPNSSLSTVNHPINIYILPINSHGNYFDYSLASTRQQKFYTHKILSTSSPSIVTIVRTKYVPVYKLKNKSFLSVLILFRSSNSVQNTIYEISLLFLFND